MVALLLQLPFRPTSARVPRCGVLPTTPLPMAGFLDGDKEEDDMWVSYIIEC